MGEVRKKPRSHVSNLYVFIRDDTVSAFDIYTNKQQDSSVCFVSILALMSVLVFCPGFRPRVETRVQVRGVPWV